MLEGLDEPVRRYFSHAISDGAALPHGVRMAMSGHIKVGLWLPFTAEQTVDGRSFVWRARVGWGPLTPPLSYGVMFGGNFASATGVDSTSGFYHGGYYYGGAGRFGGRFGGHMYLGPGHVWRAGPHWGRGYWIWGGAAWAWYVGPWWVSPAYPGWVWMGGQWVWDGTQWVWQEGYWTTADVPQEPAVSAAPAQEQPAPAQQEEEEEEDGE